MLLTYASSSEPSGSSSEPSVEPSKEVPPLRISIVELGSLQMKPIALPEGAFYMKRMKE